MPGYAWWTVQWRRRHSGRPQEDREKQTASRLRYCRFQDSGCRWPESRENLPFNCVPALSQAPCATCSGRIRSRRLVSTFSVPHPVRRVGLTLRFLMELHSFQRNYNFFPPSLFFFYRMAAPSASEEWAASLGLMWRSVSWNRTTWTSLCVVMRSKPRATRSLIQESASPCSQRPTTGMYWTWRTAKYWAEYHSFNWPYNVISILSVTRWETKELISISGDQTSSQNFTSSLLW